MRFARRRVGDGQAVVVVRKKGKGRKKPKAVLWRANESEDSLRSTMLAHLEALQVRAYSEATVNSKAEDFNLFVGWCEERALTKPSQVSRTILERYQRYLFFVRKPNGQPLSVSRQAVMLTHLRQYFRWLCHANYLQANPASELLLPRQGHRLPRYVMTPEEVKTVLGKPNVETLVGLRDRAMMEVLWATGLRRAELVKLSRWDVNRETCTVFVREGKGKRDRVVPIGGQALAWVQRYEESVRPRYAKSPDEGVLFLNESGESLMVDWVSKTVKTYLVSAGIRANGSCHLFRHACATAMLEGGADVRFVQELLGHASLATTQVYTRVAISKLKAVYAAAHPAGGSASSDARESKAESEVMQDELLESLAQEEE